VGMRMPRLQGTYTSFYEYMYFKTHAGERGSNRGVDGRIDAPLGRFRPFFTAGITTWNDRPTAEIDTRAHRLQSRLGTGVAIAAFSRTTLNVGYRHTGIEYDGQEVFRGINLSEELNGNSDSVTFGAEMVLTPLTTIALSGEHVQDRFDTAPERDANSYRVGMTATMQPLALISGHASLGIRAFRPLTGELRDFTGLIAEIAVGYSFRDDLRLNVTLDRDLRYSFSELTPYYISTGGRATITKQVLGNLDVQAFAGLERIAYQARVGAGATGDTDSVRTIGGGVGYRLINGARLGFNIDRVSRSSPAPDHEYARARLYSTLTYGF
jgi:Putative beta-barrel porin 2